MSGAVSVAYIAEGRVGAAMRRLDEVDAVEPVRVDGELAGLLALRRGSVSALVLPGAPIDVPVAAGGAPAHGTTDDVTVVVAGDDGPESVARLPGDLPEAALDRRLRAVVEEQRVAEALDRHDRLDAAARRIGRSASSAGDRVAVERLVHDELVRAAAYRSVWVGRYDPEAGALDLAAPVRGRFEAAPGSGETGFVAESMASGTVVVRRREGGPYSSPRPDLTDRATTRADGGSAVAAVPFVHEGTAFGVAILEAPATGAFDGAERALLGEVGAAAGAAIASTVPRGAAAPGRLKRLVDVLAHEIRDPLEVASAYLDLRRARGDEDAIERVETAIGTIEGYLDDVTALVRPGGLDAVEPVDVDALARRAWAALDTASADLVADAGVRVRADPDLLEGVLSNFLRNAVEHAGPDVSVRVGSLAAGAGFYVEDDGPGIPPSIRETVFEWGFSTTPGGLGLGLGYVREVVEAHGWAIEATAAETGGARFEIRTLADREPTESAATRLDALFDEWEASRQPAP